jgi:ribosomal protein S18 acetylase RimI-like enzyme
MTADVHIREAVPSDRPAILALADRLHAFGPTTRDAAEIAQRERVALSDALSEPSNASSLLVAERALAGIVGAILLDERRDYFTNDRHGHVSILAVAREAEGQGIGAALLAAAEKWGRAKRFTRLTLSVFTENLRARHFYERHGWRPEIETWYKTLGDR